MDRIGLLILLIAALQVAGCAGQQQAGQSPPPDVAPGGNSLQLAELLPPLPDPRAASIVFVTEIHGRDTTSRSLNAVDDGTALQLASATDAMAFGIYRFKPYEKQIMSLQVMMTIPDGDAAYVALGDYSGGRWQIEGPFSGDQVLALDNTRHKSQAGYTFVAVIAAGGDQATVQKLVLTANSDWKLLNVDGIGFGSGFPSLAVVDGCPAISYCEETSMEEANGLKYVRAEDAQGLSWGTPQKLRDGLGYLDFSYTSLAVVSGNPAISFCEAEVFTDLKDGALAYIRASDTVGDAWGAAQYLDPYPDTGVILGRYSSLAVIEGVPAIGYCSSSGWVKYIHASDALGLAWNPPETVAKGQFSSLAAGSDGLAVICFYDDFSNDLRIAGADLDGVWNPPTLVDDCLDAVGSYCSMARVSYDLGISYYNETQCDLKYAWYNPQAEQWDIATLDSAGDVGSHTSLAVINGRPAVSYYDATNCALKYVQALDSKGAAWGVPETVDATWPGVGSYSSLTAVDDKPAISYGDELGYLKYAIRLEP